MRVGAENERSKFNNCVHLPLSPLWNILLYSCCFVAHQHATPMWTAWRQGRAPFATGDDYVVGVICATIPWATPSVSTVRALLLVSIKKLHLGLCRCSRELLLIFGILLDRSLLSTYIFFVSMPRPKKTWFYPQKTFVDSLLRNAKQMSKSSATKLVQQIQGNTHDEMRPLGESEGKKSDILCQYANHSRTEAATHLSLPIGGPRACLLQVRARLCWVTVWNNYCKRWGWLRVGYIYFFV